MEVIWHGDWCNFIGLNIYDQVALGYHIWALREQNRSGEPWMFYVGYLWAGIMLVLIGFVILWWDHFRRH